MEHIQLCALVYEKDVKNCGFSCILNQVINDLQKLENVGISVLHNGHTINIKGSLIAIAGDNLGSHQIGGFVESFQTSGYFCRYCYIHNIQNQNDLSKIFEKRRKDLHMYDVNMALATNNNFHGVKSN